MGKGERLVQAWRKRSVAWLCAVGMALIAVFGIGGAKLHGKRAEAVEAFFAEEYSPYADLMECRESAYNLMQAGKDLPKGEEALRKTAQALEKLEKASSPQDYYRANQALEEAVDALYTALEGAELPERQEKAAYRQYNNFCGRQNSLRLDDAYNGKAEEYNRLCGGFPAWVIARVTGNGPLPVFEHRDRA